MVSATSLDLTFANSFFLWRVPLTTFSLAFKDKQQCSLRSSVCALVHSGFGSGSSRSPTILSPLRLLPELVCVRGIQKNSVDLVKVSVFNAYSLKVQEFAVELALE